ncbi:MAG: hypothetical protein R6V61_02065 [Wenzhouxiangellaceae bacterium]
MNRVEVTAPGKLLLIGEYAVLDGANALVMAVDRRARVVVAPAAERSGRLNAPQLGIHREPMMIADGVLRCPGRPQADLGLTARMIPGIVRSLDREPEEITSLDLEIDSGELFESSGTRPVKLGLGSSAAVSAALALALEAWFEAGWRAPQPGRLLHRWLPVYRSALGGTASGADLAASFCGGLSEFRIAGGQAGCRALEWPEGLYWRAVWVGHAARTTDFVGAYERWKHAEPEAAKEIGAGLGQVAQRAVAACSDAAVLVEACAEYAELLVALGDAMDLQVMSAPHRRLAGLGRDCGVVYKSCGAGGGDLGIALATDPERLGAFEKGLSDCACVPLDLSVSDFGAKIAKCRSPGAGVSK